MEMKLTLELIKKNSIQYLIYVFPQKKEVKLTKEDAEKFYEEHKGKPFYDALIEYMTQGPVLAYILSGK